MRVTVHVQLFIDDDTDDRVPPPPPALYHPRDVEPQCMRLLREASKLLLRAQALVQQSEIQLRILVITVVAIPRSNDSLPMVTNAMCRMCRVFSSLLGRVGPYLDRNTWIGSYRA